MKSPRQPPCPFKEAKERLGSWRSVGGDARCTGHDDLGSRFEQEQTKGCDTHQDTTSQRTVQMRREWLRVLAECEKVGRLLRYMMWTTINLFLRRRRRRRRRRLCNVAFDDEVDASGDGLSRSRTVTLLRNSSMSVMIFTKKGASLPPP
jgi:hypothetical protein